MADLSHARAAKSRLRTALAAHEGIRGIGLAVADDGYLLQVNVVSGRPEDVADVPAAVDGVPVRVRVVGPVQPLSPVAPALTAAAARPDGRVGPRL